MEAIRVGMTVYDEDGKKLGKIVGRDGDDLVIEKGFLSRKEYVVTIDDVARVEEDRILLRQSAEAVEAPHEEDEGQATARTGAREVPGAERMAAAPDDDDEVLVFIDEEFVIDLEGEEPGAARPPGRTPSRGH
jgi:hypothetical protein